MIKPTQGGVAAPVHLPKPHSILQPPLRELAPGERVVRVAGLKFILPCQFEAGFVLDEFTAEFLNISYHTAIINRFKPTRELLLENPAATYEDLDSALQGHFEQFVLPQARTRSPEPEPPEPDEAALAEAGALKALIAFARPHYNKAMKGHGLGRKEYETHLLNYVSDNRSMLEDLMSTEKKRLKSIMSKLSAVQD